MTSPVARSTPSALVRYEKADDKWGLTKPREETGQKNKVDELLDELDELRAKSIAEYDKKKADLKEYGLDKPEITVRVELADGARHEVSVGKEEGDVRYVLSSQSPFVLTSSNAR